MSKYAIGVINTELGTCHHFVAKCGWNRRSSGRWRSEFYKCRCPILFL